ncbi:MAG: cell division protein, partial [Clostridia bacterium]|nr:cell division protein [Clostridia bacterium]
MQKSVRQKLQSLKTKTDYYDYNLLAAVILLICFGLVMLYSTSSYEAQLKFNGDDMYYFRRQAIISAGAIIFAIIISRWNYHLLIPVAGLAYVVSLILMAMVRFTPLGVSAYGSRRWLQIGIQFQPSEIAKIAVIIYLPVIIIKMGKQVRTIKAVGMLLFFGALQGGAAFILTDNLSTGLIIGGIAVVMIFIAHPKTRVFVISGAALAGIIGSIITYMGVTMTTSDDFRIRRILAWLHPEENMSGGGYQVMQALYAIGSGGFFGKGLGNSAQKLGTIPEAQND